MTRTWWQRPAIVWAITLLSAAGAFGCSGSSSTTPSHRPSPSVTAGSPLAATTVPTGGSATGAPGDITSAAATTSATGATVPTIAAGATEAPGDAPGTGGEHCGTERWPVKTLSDGDAARVNFNPVPATVSDLRALPAPGSLPQSSRIAPTELTTFS